MIDLFAAPTDEEINERQAKRQKELLVETLKLEEAINRMHPQISRTVNAAMRAMFR